MLSKFNPVATLATADMSKARSFYEDTLGLTPQSETGGGLTYLSGNGTVFLYESAYAGTNKATALSFDVPTSEFDAEIDALRQKGIEFVTFEAEGMEWNDGVASIGESTRTVWFTDPDGNILNVSTGEM